MTPDQIVGELQRYDAELGAFLERFSRTRDGLHINRSDDPVYRQYVQEIVDLLQDALGSNPYSLQIVNEANDGIRNIAHSPSYKSVENIRGIVKAAVTRLQRNPDLLERRKATLNTTHRENIFLIHGRDEAKWRELKDIVRDEFRLNPIVLLEQPDAGCKTVIEKFEHYAQTCSFAIAVFTPDDEVTSGDDTYLQARPNVIYELGWFCGKLGRDSVMLLLKNKTELFSDFGGIIQKRFSQNISEKIVEIRRDLVAAGILDEA